MTTLPAKIEGLTRWGQDYPGSDIRPLDDGLFIDRTGVLRLSEEHEKSKAELVAAVWGLICECTNADIIAKENAVPNLQLLHELRAARREAEELKAKLARAEDEHLAKLTQLGGWKIWPGIIPLRDAMHERADHRAQLFAKDAELAQLRAELDHRSGGCPVCHATPCKMGCDFRAAKQMVKFLREDKRKAQHALDRIAEIIDFQPASYPDDSGLVSAVGALIAEL